jgi:hypothetical protein
MELDGLQSGSRGFCGTRREVGLARERLAARAGRIEREGKDGTHDQGWARAPAFEAQRKDFTLKGRTQCRRLPHCGVWGRENSRQPFLHKCAEAGA